MTKAAVLTTCGDIFITSLLLKLWKERWFDEIDKMYVNFNNHCSVPPSVVGEFFEKYATHPKTVLIYHPVGIGNGPPQEENVRLAKEELLLLLEDDCFAFESGRISYCFQQIESGLCDIVGSPRFSCGQEIAEAAKTKYNLNYNGYGDRGPHQWPAFFFVKRKDLLKTDLDFGSKTFLPGEYCKELNHTFKEINHGDTAVWMCIQLRAMGLRIQDIPQFHFSPTEPQDKKNKLMNWYKEQKPHWYHIGSLSSGWNGYLSGKTPNVSSEMAKLEIESRVAGWTLASDIIDGFDSFKIEYKKGISQLIQNANLDQRRIQEKYDLMREVMRV